MKKLAVVAVVLLSVTQANEVRANEQLAVLATLPVYFFVETAFHEGSHALAATVLDVEVKGVYPYPERRNGQNYWGRTELAWPDRVDPRVVVAEKLAPYFTDALMFTSVDLLLTFHPRLSDTVGGAMLYLAGMVAPFIDFVYNLYNPDLTCDFGLAAEYSGQPRALFYAVGSVVAAVALWRVIQTGVRVFS